MELEHQKDEPFIPPFLKNMTREDRLRFVHAFNLPEPWLDPQQQVIPEGAQDIPEDEGHYFTEVERLYCDMIDKLKRENESLTIAAAALREDRDYWRDRYLKESVPVVKRRWWEGWK